MIRIQKSEKLTISDFSATGCGRPQFSQKSHFEDFYFLVLVRFQSDFFNTTIVNRFRSDQFGTKNDMIRFQSVIGQIFYRTDILSESY